MNERHPTLRIAGTLLVAVLFLFSPANAWAAASTTGSVLLDRAESLIDEGKNNAAVVLLDRFIAKNPRSARAFLDRGDARDALGDHIGALADYDAALAINPDYADAYAERCHTKSEIGKYDEAIADCSRAIALNPKDVHPYHVRSYAHRMNDEADLARADAARAIALDNSDWIGYLYRCQALADLKKYSEALMDCNKAVTLLPDGSDESDKATMYYDRGRVNVDLQHWAKVIPDMQKAVNLGLSDDTALYWLALAYYGLADYSDAFYCINRYVSSEAVDGDGLLLRAKIKLKQDKRYSALVDATVALKTYRVHNDESGIAHAQAFLKANAPLSGTRSGEFQRLTRLAVTSNLSRTIRLRSTNRPKTSRSTSR